MVLPSDQARMYFATVAKSIRAEAVAIPGLAAALQRSPLQAQMPLSKSLPSLSLSSHSASSDLRPHLFSTVLRP